MWFFCKRSNLKAPGTRKATLDTHLTWMQTMHEARKIVLSGPSPISSSGCISYARGHSKRLIVSRRAIPILEVGDSTYELTQWNIRQIMGVSPFAAAGLGLPDRL